MKKILLATAFVCLTAGLIAQPFDGGANFPPNARKDKQTPDHRLRSNPRQEQSEEKTLNPRSPSNKLELMRLKNRHLVQPYQPKETVKPAEASEKAQLETIKKPGPLPKPVSGPGNPLAPPPKIQYAPMPVGKKVFECSHCHYIYYTNYMPDIVKCEKAGFNHEWHLIGLKGTIWFRCINCNTHVCCTKTPIRSQCDLETKHTWEVVGQLTPIQQKEEVEKEKE